MHLDGNGGTVNGVDKVDLNFAIDEDIIVPTLERKGYKFTHWSKYDGDNLVEEVSTFPTICNFKDMKLVANWEPINYIVRFYYNHHPADEALTFFDVEAVYDEPVPVSNLEGMYGTDSFKGWAFAMNDLIPAIGKVVKEGTTTHYAYVYYPPTDSERTNIGNPTYEGEIINMYAVWESRHFYVYLHDAINDPITTDALRKIRNMIGYGYTYGFSEYLTGVEKQIGTVSDVEYVFSGWSTSEVELGDPNANSYVKYYDGQKSDYIFDQEKTPVINLYAVWVPKTDVATVVFDANGGTIGGENRRTVKFAKNDSLTFPDVEDVERIGYEFDGWYDEITGNTYDIDDDVNVDFDGIRVLKAKWTAGEYEIYYTISGEGTEIIEGSPASENREYFAKTYSGDELTTIADNNSFTRPGYKFVGWDTSPAATTVIYKPGDEVEPLAKAGGRIHLHAVWEQRTYTVEYYNSDGGLVGTNTLLVGKNVRILPNVAMGEESRDAGYDYTVGGVTYHFSSGQSVSANELKITSGLESDDSQMYLRSNRNITNTDESLFGGALIESEQLFGTSDDDSTLKLYGTTSEKSYMIDFDANGGEYQDGSQVSTSIAKKGESMENKYPTTNPTKEGNRFMGWTVNGSPFDAETYPYSESIIAVADWELVGSAPSDGDTGSTDSGDTGDTGGTDSGNTDSGNTDSGNTDSGNTDSGNTDSGNTDSGNTDSGNTDSGNTDSGNTDSGNTDSGNTDSGNTDSGNTDSGNTDSGNTDSGNTDSGNTDSGNTDSGNTDSGNTDSGNTDSGNTDTGSGDTGNKDNKTKTVSKPVSPSGGGPGGGGGGRAAGGIPVGTNPLTGTTPLAGTTPLGGTLQKDVLGACVVNAPIIEKDTKWILDANNERVGLNIRRDSELGTALLITEDVKTQYIDSGNADYIQVKNGFYSVGYKGTQYFFAFDDAGKMQKGLIKIAKDTPVYGIDEATQELVKLGEQDAAKYYLMESGDFEGALWSTPITANYVHYEFDNQGRIIKETSVSGTKVDNENADISWKYDPITNNWKYYEKDETGNVRYLQNEARGIDYKGKVYYYIFDENGNMQTGLTKFNGDMYYLQESGPLKGTVYVGKLELGGTQYVFDTDGKLVSSSKEALAYDDMSKVKVASLVTQNLFVEENKNTTDTTLPQIDTKNILPVDLGGFVAKVLKLSK